jgi:TolB-like protein/AraC-like DNA-binding protein
MSTDQLLDVLKAEVERNLQNEQFGVEELAESAGMSRSNLHRKLQEVTGQSTSQFIREYRLERALDILTHEEANVSEVAYRVGFGSPSYFSKTFTEFYGYPPVEAKIRNTSSPNDHPKYMRPKNRARLLVALGGVFAILLAAVLYVYFNYQKDVATTSSEEVVTIAIIPFKNLNRDESNQYFADGVMDALLNKLSKVGQLRVTSRTSVEQFRNTTKSIPEIGKELNVAYILEGSAQKYDDQIKIIAQLVDVRTDAHVWSQEYTRTFEDVLNLQGEIAENVALELKVALSIEEREVLRELPTKNAEAYNYFLLGYYQYNKQTNDGLTDAIPLFEKAIEIDPNFVEAYAGLADAWVVCGLFGIYRQNEAWDQASKLLNKARKLEPNNAAVYDILAAGNYFFEWNFTKAYELFSQVKEITGHYGTYSPDFYVKIGELENAIASCDDLITLDPLQSWYYYKKAEANLLMGRTTEALRILDATRTFDNYLLLHESARFYYLSGMIDKSVSTMSILKNNYSDRGDRVIWLEAVHALYEGSSAEPFIDELKERYHNNYGSSAWFIALVYVAKKNDELVFEWLERSYQRREVAMTWLKMEPALDRYKEDPRYLELLDRMNFPE